MAKIAANLRDYACITGAYWTFTLTDGALRMLVLLFLYQQGFTPIALASLFLFYEFFGVLTNLFGGIIGARFGLKVTLFAGLLLQVLACGMLGLASAPLTVVYVMFAQSLSGIAKDLTKMSSKSYIKLVVPEASQGRLLEWVTLLTGSKNALKGAGYFLGGWMLSTLGFHTSCLVMAGAVLMVLGIAMGLLPSAPGKMTTPFTWGMLWPQDQRIRWLSGARLFLFGSRDVWFAIALPVYLSSVLGWSHSYTGGFLALWIIGYGFVQATVPKVLGKSAALESAKTPVLSALTTSLLFPLGGLMLALLNGYNAVWSLVLGLGLFGVLFAINSALHSYLIVSYAERDKVAMGVGFYYMANAWGRLFGTLLSGVIFQWGGVGGPGLVSCLAASVGFVAVARWATGILYGMERVE